MTSNRLRKIWFRLKEWWMEMINLTDQLVDRQWYKIKMVRIQDRLPIQDRWRDDLWLYQYSAIIIYIYEQQMLALY